MNILVILRNVADSLEELPLLDGFLDLEEAAVKLNEFDDCALEEAILLKEETGATVIAAAMEAAGDRVLQTAAARGADRVVKIAGDYPEGASSWSMAPVYAEVAKVVAADLVLTGVQCPDDVFGQLAPLLGTRANWPHSSGVTAVKAATAGKVDVIQEYEGGRSATLTLSLPAVVGVQSSRQPPRYVSGSRLRQAVQSTSIETLAVAAEAAPTPGRIDVQRFPEKTGSVELLPDDPGKAASALIEVLRKAGVDLEA